MTLFPRKATRSQTEEQQLDSLESDSQIQERKEDQTLTQPLLSSSSTNVLGGYDDNDGSSEVAMLLAMGDGAVKKKRRLKREDFKLTEALVKAYF
ncbi:hypothetical protein TanjilG_21027 [Lupinus angustifolius]|uniref:Uncharacterized protein n=1 Tax=Lupinus angustifolius TaxID=3871 RepID=A0A394DC32_LUPAN|nr:hypothetical protein TanjilG_21027 [Lupinus angustifolius]